MIEHSDWDAGTKRERPYKLPDKINEISFYHDGGRVSICINKVEVYNGGMGETRDCRIVLNNEEVSNEPSI